MGSPAKPGESGPAVSGKKILIWRCLIRFLLKCRLAWILITAQGQKRRNARWQQLPRALLVGLLSMAAFKHAGGVRMTALGAMTVITVFDVPVFTASQVQVFCKFLIEFTGFGPESFIFILILH